MQTDTSKVHQGRERFHDLVSSRVLIPREWYDEAGQRQCSYDLGENKRAADYLDRLQKAVVRIAASKTPPWRVEGGKANRFVISREARSLWHAIRSIGLAPKAYGREDEMNPYLSVGVRLARKWEPRLRFFTNVESELLISEEYPRRMLAHIVYVIRRTCAAKKFVKRVKRLETQHKDNLESFLTYVLSIFRVCARPLVLRGDCYVDAEAKQAASEGKIEKAIEKLIRNLREDRIIDDVIGYIVKIEPAYGRGLHLHWMAFVDGDKHFQSYNLTEEIKWHWIHKCVGSASLASGFNCYLRKDEYRYNCIGLVHYTDEDMLRGIREAVRYLMKTDGHFILPRSFGNSVRKGHAPKAEGAKRGAPRKYPNGVSIAERILLQEGSVT